MTGVAGSGCWRSGFGDGRLLVVVGLDFLPTETGLGAKVVFLSNVKNHWRRSRLTGLFCSDFLFYHREAGKS